MIAHTHTHTHTHTRTHAHAHPHTDNHTHTHTPRHRNTMTQTDIHRIGKLGNCSHDKSFSLSLPLSPSPLSLPPSPSDNFLIIHPPGFWATHDIWRPVNFCQNSLLYQSCVEIDLCQANSAKGTQQRWIMDIRLSSYFSACCLEMTASTCKLFRHALLY